MHRPNLGICFRSVERPWLGAADAEIKIPFVEGPELLKVNTTTNNKYSSTALLV